MVVQEGGGGAAITGRPARMAMFARTASHVEDDLAVAAASLGATLDALRDSAGWSEFLVDVPPLDVHVRTTAARLGQLAQDVATFGRALRRLDGQLPHDEPIFDLPWLSPDEPAVFERDGTLYVVGSDRGEHIRLRFEHGRWEVTVTTGDDIGTTHVAAGEVGQVVVLAGGGHDVVDVPANCTVSMVVDAGDGDDMVAHLNAAGVISASTGGDGDDRLFMGAGDDVALGGLGNDRIHLGPSGASGDYADGGDGDDLITAGSGHAALYGGRGNDILRGGADDDTVQGGSGHDAVDGEGGDDLVAGGRGNDRLSGGGGDDTLLGGVGDDAVAGGGGVDQAHVESADEDADSELRVTVKVEARAGAAAFELARPDWMTGAEWTNWLERIDADLMLLRSTRAGSTGLRVLGRRSAVTETPVHLLPDGRVTNDASTSPLTRGDREVGQQFELQRRLARGVQRNSSAARPQADPIDQPFDRWDHPGQPAQVALDPLSTAVERPVPSAIVLLHELVHSHDYMGGGTPGQYTERVVDSNGRTLLDADGEPLVSQDSVAELNAVGLDLDGDGRDDGFPDLQGVVRPPGMSENALRRELRWFPRQSYIDSTNPLAAHVRIVVTHPDGDRSHQLPIDHDQHR